jgi:arabinose-5-phosphate isomerase
MSGTSQTRNDEPINDTVYHDQTMGSNGFTSSDLQRLAVSVLKNEAEALLRAAEHVNEEFENCVEAVFNMKGRLVLTGVGKSAIIGQKITATLNSTGTPALFMHGADAIHGDLGMIQKDDLVMCISKSGNTPEIKVLVPLLKRRGLKLIALVSNRESYLAREADHIIDGTIVAEACPNNLAPTTSTTVHLALGDALAICLLRMKNFSRHDFAAFHPGGALGKQLYLKVGDILRGTMPVVQKHATIKEVIFEISSKRLGAVVVIDGGIPMGIITDGDLRRLLEHVDSLEAITAAQIMSLDPKAILKEEFATRALQIMQHHKISQLVVVEDNKMVGLLHLHDLLREGIV